jgi:hypothetical protein
MQMPAVWSSSASFRPAPHPAGDPRHYGVTAALLATTVARFIGGGDILGILLPQRAAAGAEFRGSRRVRYRPYRSARGMTWLRGYGGIDDVAASVIVDRSRQPQPFRLRLRWDLEVRHRIAPDDDLHRAGHDHDGRRRPVVHRLEVDGIGFARAIGKIDLAVIQGVGREIDGGDRSIEAHRQSQSIHQ